MAEEASRAASRDARQRHAGGCPPPPPWKRLVYSRVATPHLNGPDLVSVPHVGCVKRAGLSGAANLLSWAVAATTKADRLAAGRGLLGCV